VIEKKIQSGRKVYRKNKKNSKGSKSSTGKSIEGDEEIYR